MLDLVTNLIPSVIASTPVRVPDSGVTAVLLSAGVLSLGLFARFMKNRKK